MITRLSLVWKKVKSALFSKTSKELFIFLCFFFMSAVFWVLQALDEVREQTIDIPVSYRNVPDDVVITSNPPEVLKVIVQDNGMNLLNYRLRRSVKPVVFDFNDFEGKGYLLKMENADIQKQIIDNLNSSTKLISFKPESFDVVYTRGKAKRVPVRLAGNITAKQQYDITFVELEPDSVMIYAPQEVLDTISAMYTSSETYHDITDSISFQSELQNYVNVKAVPNKVKVKVFVEQLTEKTLEVPVNAINVP
jgi:YbbR domain-containing protein